MLGKLALAEHAGEEASVVRAGLDVDDECAFELGFSKNHFGPPSLQAVLEAH